MLKKEELEAIETLKELSEEQIKDILDLAQSKGDGVKKKYQTKEEELSNKLEELTKELETLKESKKDEEDDVDNTLKDKANELLMKKIDELNSKISNIEKEKNTSSTKSQLLEAAKEKGFDLKHASALFETLGDNLDGDLTKYESLLIKSTEEEDEIDTPDGGDKGSEKEAEIFETGDPVLDSILLNKQED